MPVVIRGCALKKGTKLTGLRWIKRQAAGWYTHMMKHGKQAVEDFGMRWLSSPSSSQRREAAASEVVVCCVARQRFAHRNPRTVSFAFRHREQFSPDATGTNLHLHAKSKAAAVLSGRMLILRNLWVWIHHMHLAEGRGDAMTLHLELLRFKRMLDWIVCEILALFHDGSIPYVIQPP